MQAIADKANRLITMHVPQGHDACAAVAADKDLDVSILVATIQGVRRKKFKLPVAKHPQQQ
jgi:vacuolar-type H+-ATPase subunit D/Vma8